MSLPRYGEYKNSGIPWIGAVPQHWSVMPLKRDLGFLTSGSRGWAEHYSDDGALFIRIGNLTRDSIKLNLSDIQRVAVPDMSEGERTMVMPGDVLFSITAYLGSVAVVPEGLERAFVSQHVALARLEAKKVLPTWAAYVAASEVGRAYLGAQGYGGTKIQLSLDDVAGLTLPVPPISEQSAIVAFLNRETAKIDALIAEQEKLISLLAEKRHATISHAVTRGLNPNAPMKDSGVAWLGEVPAHWAISRVKQIALSFEQGWSPQCENFPAEDEETWGVLRVGCVNGGTFDPTENKKLPRELDALAEYALTLREGDLLVSRANTRDLVGSAAVVPRDFPRLLLCDKLYRIRLAIDQCLPPFLAAFMGTREARGQIQLDATGASSSMLNIGQSVVRELPLPLPRVDEQQEIIEFLQHEATRFDALSAEALRAIDLFKERRAALISAAVTGQIDVRNAA